MADDKQAEREAFEAWYDSAEDPVYLGHQGIAWFAWQAANLQPAAAPAQEPVAEWQWRHIGDPRQKGYWKRCDNADWAKDIYEGAANHIRDVWEVRPLFAAPAQAAAPVEMARSISDEMMDLVDRLGSEWDKVDPRAWRSLLIYAPKDAVTNAPGGIEDTHLLAIARTCKLIGNYTTMEQMNAVVGYARVVLNDKAVQEAFVRANRIALAATAPAAAPVAWMLEVLSEPKRWYTSGRQAMEHWVKKGAVATPLYAAAPQDAWHEAVLNACIERDRGSAGAWMEAFPRARRHHRLSNRGGQGRDEMSSAMICRKTMRNCHTPNMCSPFGGCQPDEMSAKHIVGDGDWRPVSVAVGWKCPVCGKGNAPFMPTCGNTLCGVNLNAPTCAADKGEQRGN